jgi:hypothetical protein
VAYLFQRNEPLPDDGQVWPEHVAQFNFNFNIKGVTMNKVALSTEISVNFNLGCLHPVACVRSR